MQFTALLGAIALTSSLVSAQCSSEWFLESYTDSDCGQDDNSLAIGYYGDTAPSGCTAFDSSVTIESVSFDANAQWVMHLYENADCTCPLTVGGIFNCPDEEVGESSGSTQCIASSKYLSFDVTWGVDC